MDTDASGSQDGNDHPPQTPPKATAEQLQLLNLLQKIDQRLESVEARLGNLELRDHKQQVQQGFPQFSRLPIELRRRIWDMSIPQRKLRHHYINRPAAANIRPVPITGLSPPIASRVCRESRLVACYRGGIFPLFKSFKCRYWTWFDGTHDVLELGTMDFLDEPLLGDGFMDILRRAETILVNMWDFDTCRFHAMLENQDIRRTLRTVNFQPTPPEAVTKSSWDPQVVAKLFRSDSVVMVDLEDSARVQEMQLLLSAHNQLKSAGFNSWLINWKEQEEDEEDDSITIAWARTLFKMAWLFHGNGKKKPESPYRVKSFNLEDPEIQEDLSGMPHIRLVYTMELAGDGQPIDDQKEQIWTLPWPAYHW
ncbi:Fc.00g036800.m01.CDS01 [Cosmosporella sp. VM-42]